MTTRKGKWDRSRKAHHIRATKPFGDFDKDNVPNLLDCQPFNPYEHGFWGDVWGAVKQRIVAPIYQRVYQPHVAPHVQRVRTGISTMQTTAQQYAREYTPSISYERAAKRRRVVIEKLKKVKKRIPEKKVIARTIIRTTPKGIIATEAIKHIPKIRKGITAIRATRAIGRPTITRTPRTAGITPKPVSVSVAPGQMGLLMGAEATLSFWRQKAEEIKKLPSAIRTVFESQKKTSPRYIATGIAKEKVLSPLQKGYEIGTGKYIEEEQKALTEAETARIKAGTGLATELGFESRESMRAQMEEAGRLYEDPSITKYYGATRGVSEAYTPEVEAWYGRVEAYQKIPTPTEAQYRALMKTKPSGVAAFETVHTSFIGEYSTTPDIVTQYEELSKPFLTGTGKLKPSVGAYITLSGAEEAAYFALQAKEAKVKEEWAPDYPKGYKPFLYPTMEAGAWATKRIMKHVEKIPETGLWRVPRGVSEFVATLPEWAGSIPPSAELMVTKTPTTVASIPLGLGLLGGAMAKEAAERPVVFGSKMAAMVALPYVGKKISPIRYTKLQIPTGKGQIKTRFTFKGDIPPEVLKWQEMGVWGTGLGKVEPTRIPFLQKQTYMVPEAVTYKGLYFRAPTRATTPYLGKHFLVGRVRGSPGTIRGWQVGHPKFELPVSYRVFTPVEAAATLPSMKASLRVEQQQLMTEMLYLQRRLGGRRGIVKPLKIKETELFEGAPEGFLRDVSTYMRKYRRDMVVYGSEAKAAQIARLKGERGGISPADIDVEIRTLAARMQEGIVLPKTLQSEYTLGRLGIPTWKSGFIKRLGEKTPGLTPDKMAADLAAITKKHFGKESVQISYKPQWQMYSVEKIVGWKKTPLGKEAVTETLFDIHPESASFEFGIKPHKPIKTTIETGLGEGWWARHKKIKMTTLGEEFEHSFASIMQTQTKGGELYLAPRFKRLKDIPRAVQTGKMLSEFERLKIETGLMPFKKYRLKGIAKEEAALKHWEEYGSTFKELREFRADMTAKAISASAESILKQQRLTSSLLASEAAVAFPKRIRFEEAYKPEISKPRVGVGKEVTGDYYDVYSYPPRPSSYYGIGYYYGTPSYYGKPAYRGAPPSHKVFGFVPPPPIKHISTPPPSITRPVPVTPPPRQYLHPPPITPAVSVIPTPAFMPTIAPPTTPTPPPTPPPTRITTPPPPTPFKLITPPPPIPLLIAFPPPAEKKKKVKPKGKKAWEWLEEFTVQRPTELHFGAIESGIPKVSKVVMLPQITMADTIPKPRKTKPKRRPKRKTKKKKTK